MKSTISLATVLCIALAGILFLGAPAFAADEDSFALGDTDQDYVYTPVKPCRIVDTRAVGGPFSASETRDYYVYGEVAAQQGGASAGYPERCNAPKGEPRAVHINVTSTNAHASGWFTVWNYNGNKPAASMVNYTPGQNIANQGTIKTRYNASNPEITVFSSQASDLVIDVLGYYYNVAPLFLDEDFQSGSGATPGYHTSFLAPVAQVEITKRGQKVFVDSTNLFCADRKGGQDDAKGLELWICYQNVQPGSLLTKVGAGIGDIDPGNDNHIELDEDQAIPMGMSAFIYDLAPGIYNVGLCGETYDIDDWDGCHAPKGYTTTFVVPE